MLPQRPHIHLLPIVCSLCTHSMTTVQVCRSWIWTITSSCIKPKRHSTTCRRHHSSSRSSPRQLENCMQLPCLQSSLRSSVRINCSGECCGRAHCRGIMCGCGPLPSVFVFYRPPIAPVFHARAICALCLFMLVFLLHDAPSPPAK